MLMKARQWMTALGLLVLVLCAGAGLVLTRQSAQTTVASSARGHGSRPVDEQPLETARAMAALASGRDEQRFAEQALKVADHEVDLAFADGLRDAAAHPVAPTPQTRELFDRARKTESALKADQDRLEDLKKQLANASDSRRDALQQQVDVVQAQLELDEDEQEDAKEDLMRAGGDPLSLVQRQFDRHEAAEHQTEATRPQAGANADANPLADNLLAQFAAWRGLRARAVQLQQARAEASRAGDGLKQAHNVLEKKVGAEQSDKEAIAQQTAARIRSGPAAASSPPSGPAAAISALRRFSADQKDLADLDKRIQDQDELANTYANWSDLLRSRQRAAVHGMVQSALLIALILLAVYLASRLVDHLFTGLGAERTRLHTLRGVVRFALQAFAVLLIVFVIFGAPSQMPTILGLAGAGLTVALKDFIVAFVGWFVLMGRNGLRVGDWVEINGVVGEVVEINLLRTVLLETGNWTDTGHPTGRKVAFVNSFAIEGHFFNFSTSGQWLWDEIQILVPSSQNPYPIIDAIQKLVVKETETNARAAEQEWQRATSRHTAQSVSAAPAINLRPTTSGVEVHVRYITRAAERYATRTRLYQELVEVLHHQHAEEARAESAPAAN